MIANTLLPLEGTRVLEFGRRIAVGAAGSLLVDLGATVFFVEPNGTHADATFEDKFSQRALFAHDKQSIRCGERLDDSELQRLVAGADVIITSTDADLFRLAFTSADRAIVCDITAFGSNANAEAHPISDYLLQAMAGIADTTGESNGPPVAIGAPVVEFSTALYAASAILAALRVRRQSGTSQFIDMALYDCAVNAQATFLPSHFGGGTPRRLGNRHSMAAPWNAYRASDGWVLLCSASEAHWQKICDVVGKPELGKDSRYATLNDRMARRDEVDTVVSEWTASRTVGDCIGAMSAANIACGPIVKVSELGNEQNLRHRETIRTITASDGGVIRVPGCLFRPAKGSQEAAPTIAAVAVAAPPPRSTDPPKLPLVGIRVVELGQYTTAPLVGRHLASLGAEVIKLEPFEGDSARQWAPHRNGMSYFFVMSNSGKRSISVDLRSKEGADFFRRLLKNADVLIENMKPGSLARLGLSQAVLTDLNPRLVYTAITGFGADSAYVERPAFDTVVQAMSGVMDITRSNGTPLKAGISIADICGGQLGLLTTLAGLEQRDRTGRALSYDLSMQDVGAWLTQLSWIGERPAPGTIIAKGDGFVATDAAGQSTRVKSVAEVVADERTAVRQLIVFSPDGWPLLGSPLKLDKTPPRVWQAIGKPQPLSTDLEHELGLAPSSQAPTTRRQVDA